MKTTTAHDRGNALTLIDFHGDTLLAQRDERGVWVILKRVCEAMGLDDEGQRQRLAKKAWATTCVIKAVAEDGKSREMLAIHLDALPMWLATIDAGRVDPSIRAKVERYQVECARVLRDHFFGVNPVDARLDGMAAMLVALREEVALLRLTRPAPGLLGAPRAESLVKRKVRDLARLHHRITGDDYRSVRALMESDLRFAVSFFGAWDTLAEDRLPDVLRHLAGVERVLLRRHLRLVRRGPGLAATRPGQLPLPMPLAKAN